VDLLRDSLKDRLTRKYKILDFLVLRIPDGSHGKSPVFT